MTDFEFYEHRIIDEFLAEDIFAELCSLSVNHVEPTKVKDYHHIVSLDKTIKRCELLDRELVERIHNTHHCGMMQLLKELAPEKVELYDHSDIHVVITGKKKKFLIHVDRPQKMLTAVVYLSPEKNKGTMLYSTKAGADVYEVEWKQNRALIISTKENVTWHSYEGDGISNRLTLVYNLWSK